jgi:hypothetical protein
MAIQGPLRELGIHDVFQLLDLGRKTGILRISSPLRQNEGTIWFHDAAVVAAAIQSNPHPLGGALLAAGKIREEDLARARAMQEQGDGRRIGELLVAIGALSERDLRHVVRSHIEDVAFTMLGWSEGYFVFEECDPALIPRETELRISVEHLLLEGARRIDEWSRIQSRIPHLGIVPRLAPAESEEPGSLTLTPFEWRVLAAADGERDVQTIALSLGESEFDTARALFGLAAAGIVLLNDPARESALAAPRDTPGPLLAQGEEQLRAGSLEAARASADAALAAFPEVAGSHALAGGILLAERRFAEAERPLREAVRLAPADARARRLLAWALLGAGRLEEAVEGFTTWQELAEAEPSEAAHGEAIAAALPAARLLAERLRAVR